MSYTFLGSTLDDDTQESIDRYVSQGVPTGGFLEAVIDNNLSEAVGRAEDLAQLRMIPAIFGYLWNKTPGECWGSRASRNRWLELKNKEREAETA